ncbi:MAG: hypothetical protein ABJN40_13055 [Sneathiella sp.]
MKKAVYLKDLLGRNMRVAATCGQCRWIVEIWPGSLIEKLGPDFPIADVGPRLRCTRCNAKKAITVPSDDPDRYNNMVPGCEVRPPE